MSDGVAIRPLEDADAAGVIRLIDAIWAEYPGTVFDVDAELPELHALASHFRAKGGAGWVAVAEGVVVAMVGVVPLAVPGRAELHKLYVDHAWRRRGLACRLLALAEERARVIGARVMELWTDTRFADAHRFYAGRGYRRLPATRTLDDLSCSTEYHFEKDLG